MGSSGSLITGVLLNGSYGGGSLLLSISLTAGVGGGWESSSDSESESEKLTMVLRFGVVVCREEVVVLLKNREKKDSFGSVGGEGTVNGGKWWRNKAVGEKRD